MTGFLKRKVPNYKIYLVSTLRISLKPERSNIVKLKRITTSNSFFDLKRLTMKKKKKHYFEFMYRIMLARKDQLYCLDVKK